MNKSISPAVDEIWSILKETNKQIKTLSAETDKHIKETAEQIKTLSAETDKQMKKTDEQMKRTDEQMKRTDEQMKRTDIRIDKVVGDFGNRWGKLGENLVKGSLIQRLKERGIEVERVITNAKIGSSEFDIIAVNGTEIVVVEVKAALDPFDVKKFTKNIERFKVLWPEFKDKTVYGAMAFLIKANRFADEIARDQGFFVIEATGDIIIQNEEDFKPKIF